MTPADLKKYPVLHGCAMAAVLGLTVGFIGRPQYSVDHMHVGPRLEPYVGVSRLASASTSGEQQRGLKLVVASVTPLVLQTAPKHAPALARPAHEADSTLADAAAPAGPAQPDPAASDREPADDASAASMRAEDQAADNGRDAQAQVDSAGDDRSVREENAAVSPMPPDGDDASF